MNLSDGVRVMQIQKSYNLLYRDEIMHALSMGNRNQVLLELLMMFQVGPLRLQKSIPPAVLLSRTLQGACPADGRANLLVSVPEWH